MSTRPSSGMSIAPPEPTLDAVVRLFPLHSWKRPLCLMFDEMQNITERQVQNLEPLHLGTHGIPVVSVLAGLAHTRDVLDRLSMSRISDGADHTLGTLSYGEAAEAVEMFLDEFRIDRTGAICDWARERRVNSYRHRVSQNMRDAHELAAEVMKSLSRRRVAGQRRACPHRGDSRRKRQV